MKTLQTILILFLLSMFVVSMMQTICHAKSKSELEQPEKLLDILWWLRYPKEPLIPMIWDWLFGANDEGEYWLGPTRIWGP